MLRRILEWLHREAELRRVSAELQFSRQECRERIRELERQLRDERRRVSHLKEEVAGVDQSWVDLWMSDAWDLGYVLDGEDRLRTFREYLIELKCEIFQRLPKNPYSYLESAHEASVRIEAKNIVQRIMTEHEKEIAPVKALLGGPVGNAGDWMKHL